MTDIPEPDLGLPHPLLAAPAGPPDERQREAVFARTARILWRRRLARRLVQATALVACFVAGLLTMYWLRPPAPPREPETSKVVPTPSPVPLPPEPAALAISPDDHWLLMAIKDARQKEKNDGKTSQ